MEEIKVNAITLRAIDYGDNDKILTLLTDGKGKISAGIKGVKKAGAKLKFVAQPFCFAELVLVRKGDRYSVIQASECESFYDLRLDVGKYYAAGSLCEAVYSLTEEGDPDAELFSDCARTLSNMCNGDEALALTAFLLRLLKRCGYGISFSACPVCGKIPAAGENVRFDTEAARFLCFNCGKGAGVSGATYAALSNAHMGKDSAEREGVRRALKLLREYISVKTDVRLRSLTDYLELL